MTPPLFLTELEEDEEKDLKKWGGWMDGWGDGSLNGVISRAPVELKIKFGHWGVIENIYDGEVFVRLGINAKQI